VEKDMPGLDLIDAMINSQVGNLEKKESVVLDVGKTKEMVPGFPAFAIVSASEDGETIAAFWGTVDDDRNYSITCLTKNREGSAELSETVGRVVESFRRLSS
jgi:hypothetical protein